MSNMLVTGGNGKLGRRLVPRLLRAGHRVTVTSRTPRIRDDGIREVALDLRSGDNLEEAVRDQEVVVHLASNTAAARKVDVEGTRGLVEAARAAGVNHFVYLSIVGVDDIPFAYYEAKREAERIVEKSAIPHTILRATQFHEFLAQIGDGLGRLPVVPVFGGITVQPVDIEVVADTLAAVVEEGPSGRLPDLGGPETVRFDQAIGEYLEATGRRRLRLRLRAPGKAGRNFRSGAILTPNRDDRGKSWSEFINEVRTRRGSGGDRDRRSPGLTGTGMLIVLLGLWMLVAPERFQEAVGGFGAANAHLVRDLATLTLPLGAIVMVTARRPEWRLPVLAYALAHNTLHIANHLADAHLAEPGWLGAANVVLLVALELLILALLATTVPRPRRRAGYLARPTGET